MTFLQKSQKAWKQFEKYQKMVYSRNARFTNLQNPLLSAKAACEQEIINRKKLNILVRSFILFTL